MNKISIINERDLSLDILKIIACFGVVILHTINREVALFNSVLYYSGTISVPLFFMINGALLLNKPKISYKYCLKKIVRIFLVSLTWSILYSSLLFFIEKRNLRTVLIDIFGCYLQKGRLGIFWFYGALILIYLLLPLIHKIFKSKYSLLPLCLLILLCCSSHFLSIKQSITGDEIILSRIIQTFRLWIHLCYFYLGGFIYSRKTKLKELQIGYYWIITIFILVAVILYGYLLSSRILANSFAEYLYDSPIIIYLVSLLFFLTLRTRFHNPWIEKVSSTTMGIYVIHYNFIWNIFTMILKVQGSTLFLFMPLIIFFISFFICFLLSKNKYLKKLISL